MCMAKISMIDIKWKYTLNFEEGLPHMTDRTHQTGPVRRPIPVDTCFLFADWLAPTLAPILRHLMVNVMAWHDPPWHDRRRHDPTWHGVRDNLHTWTRDAGCSRTNWDLSHRLTYHHLNIIFALLRPFRVSIIIQTVTKCRNVSLMWRL